MRVLMTADTIGGVWTYARDLASALRDHGVTFELATMGEPLSNDQREEIADLDNVRLHESCFQLEWMEQPWEGVDRSGEWLRLLEESTNPDLIHLNGYSHAALDFTAPVMVAAHSCVTTWWNAVKGESPPPSWNHYRRRVTKGLRQAELVVAPTRALLVAMESHYDLPSSRHVIYNGADPSHFRVGQKEPFVFSAGRLWDEAKNMRRLLEAAQHLDWPLHLAGNGCEELNSPELVKPLGRLTSSGMKEVLSKASIYVHPALYEPFGLAPLEAALSGCALVLSDIPTLREVWGDAAMWCDPHSGLSIASAINELSRDPVQLKEYAERSRKRALEYSLERFGRSYLELYRTLMENSKERGKGPRRGRAGAPLKAAAEVLI